MTALGACVLCREVPERKAQRRSAAAVLVADADPVVPGHRLWVTLAHVPSFASLPGHESQLTAAFHEADDGRTVMYEHGNETWNLTGNQSIDHAHMHVVPGVVATDVLIHRLTGLAPWTEVAGLADAWAACRGRNYHLLALPGGRTLVTSTNLPSQVFRRECARAHGVPEWDWRARAC